MNRTKGAPSGEDQHVLWIDPDDPQRMILGSDQGAIISLDGGHTWSDWFTQPTGQFYHVTTDNAFPYRLYAAQQDSGSVAVLSRSDFGMITYRDWFSTGAFESGYIAPDPVECESDLFRRLVRLSIQIGSNHRTNRHRLRARRKLSLHVGNAFGFFAARSENDVPRHAVRFENQRRRPDVG